jgi:hypothetical protein
MQAPDSSQEGAKKAGLSARFFDCPAARYLLVVDWSCCTSCDMLEDEFTSVDDWLAPTLLLVDWLPEFTPTPTFGFTLVEVPPLDAESTAGSCGTVVDDERTSVEFWLADSPLCALWSPLPTLASTPTLGFAFTVWAWTGLKAASIAAATRLRVNCLRFMLSPFSVEICS